MLLRPWLAKHLELRQDEGSLSSVSSRAKRLLQAWLRVPGSTRPARLPTMLVELSKHRVILKTHLQSRSPTKQAQKEQTHRHTQTHNHKHSAGAVSFSCSTSG